MANKKQIIFNGEARTKIREGVDILARAVSMTLGPRGRAVVVEKSWGAPQVTFDGVTVAKEIKLSDPYQSLGAELVKQAADKTNDNVGDGTTTSVVLAHALISAGERFVNSKGVNVIKLAEALRAETKEIVKRLEAQAEKVEDSKRVQEVATLSAKDPEIGAMIAEVMSKSGKDGVITVDDSNTSENFYEMVEGLSFERGYISHHLITDQEKLEAVIETPWVLVTDRKLSNVEELLPMLESVMKSGNKGLVVIADDIDGEALATLVVNKLRGILNVLAIKAPGFGDAKKAMLEDIATVTGATFVSEELGSKIQSVTTETLGKAFKVVSTKDNTTIVGGAGDTEAIKTRLESLKAQLIKLEPGLDKERLNARIGKLSGGVTVIKIGAPTESAQKELKQRVEDAVAATKAAMEDGIVPGGGMALYNVITKYVLDAIVFSGESESNVGSGEVAKLMLAEALAAPLKKIVENSGEEFTEALKESLDGRQDNEQWVGFNATTNLVTDLKRDGIIDPLKVTKTALNNAVSVAANYLTIGAAIVDEPIKDEKGGSVSPGF